jgi:hypothetical protein
MKNHRFEFKSQHKVGKQGERILDEWLSQTYTISDVSDSPEYQEIGIDRLLFCSNGSTISAEYKCDVVAKRTGNLFFETISVDSKNIPGWGWSSQADCWIFLIPNQEILIVKPSLLRALVWQKYREAHKKRFLIRAITLLGCLFLYLMYVQLQIKSKNLTAYSS